MQAYAVGHISTIDMGSDIAAYLERIDMTLAPYGGKFIVHGGPLEVLEGELAGDIVIIAFPNIEQARQWYTSPEYQAILPLRMRNARSTVFLVQGVQEGHRATDVLVAK